MRRHAIQLEATTKFVCKPVLASKHHRSQHWGLNHMHPLNSVKGAITTGVVLVIIIGISLSVWTGPGGAGISKYIAPRALLWFRWSAVATWVTGALYLMIGFGTPGIIVNAFTL